MEEWPWALLRHTHFRDLESDEAAAAELGAWSRRHGIAVTLEGRTVGKLQVVYVRFARR